MKKKYQVSRRVCVPIDEYKNVHYEHSIEVEYSDQEIELTTIIDSVEFKHLSNELDKAQRKAIEEDCGITELIIDKMKFKNRKRFIKPTLQVR